MTNRTTGIATKWSRRMLCAAAALALMGGSALAQNSIKIGWAISKTGPFAGGATSPRCPTTSSG